MRKVGVSEARTHFYQLLAQVEKKNERIIIRRHGKDMAMLIPCQEAYQRQPRMTPEEILAGLREIRDKQKSDPGAQRPTAKDFINDGRER